MTCTRIACGPASSIGLMEKATRRCRLTLVDQRNRPQTSISKKIAEDKKACPTYKYRESTKSTKQSIKGFTIQKPNCTK